MTYRVDVGDEIDKIVEANIQGIQALLAKVVRKVEETLRKEKMGEKELKAALAAYERLFLMLITNNICHGILASILNVVNPDMERLFPSHVRLCVETLTCASASLLGALAPVVTHERMSPILQRLLLAWSVTKTTNEILRSSLTSDFMFTIITSSGAKREEDRGETIV